MFDKTIYTRISKDFIKTYVFIRGIDRNTAVYAWKFKSSIITLTILCYVGLLISLYAHVLYRVRLVLQIDFFSGDFRFYNPITGICNYANNGSSNFLSGCYY